MSNGRTSINDVNPRNTSLVDYSMVLSRPIGEKQPSNGAAVSSTNTSSMAVAAPAVVSAQMDAVMRLMTGREERTIAEKLADSNRPTWEQYKKDNHDKLNLDSLDQKQMDEYRKQLDEERDRRMAGIPVHDSNKKDKKTKKHHKKKHRRKDDSDESSEKSITSCRSGSSHDDDNQRRRRHKKHRKNHDKKRKHRSRDDDSETDKDDEGKKETKKKHNKKPKNDDSNPESDGEHYRLSSFFAK